MAERENGRIGEPEMVSLITPLSSVEVTPSPIHRFSISLCHLSPIHRFSDSLPGAACRGLISHWRGLSTIVTS
jgi:hypothetical protein